MKQLLATGALTWESAERRSDRYGAIHLHGDHGDRVVYNTTLLETLLGHRVRLTVKVVATRKSEHVGDLTHGFRPSTPDVGEVIDLGVGTLYAARGWDGQPDIILEPGDGRTTFWFDPRKLYRLHDQTVEVYVEKTRTKFSPAPEFKAAKAQTLMVEKDGLMNTTQVKGAIPTRILPKVTPLGEGLFAISMDDYKVGERVQTDRDPFDDVDE